MILRKPRADIQFQIPIPTRVRVLGMIWATKKGRGCGRSVLVMAGVQESVFLEDGTSKDTMIRHYALNGLSTQYIQRLLQAKRFTYSKRHIRRLRQDLGVGSSREEASLPEVCEAVRVSFVNIY